MMQWFERAKQFLYEVRVELKKVTWPSRKETTASTTVVIIAVLLSAIFLGVVDFGLSRLIHLLIH